MQWLTTKRVSTFTNKPYAGNPAWVVIGADRSVEEQKLVRLASELNPVSDTVFVYPEKDDADIGLRFFSQSEEIAFSGHGTIAAYFGVEGENLIKLTEPITLVKQKTKSGIQHIELRIKDNKIERVTVSLPAPQIISTPLDVKQISRFLGIPPVEILDANRPIGVVEISGCVEIIVPVVSSDVLLNLTPNFQLMKNFCDRLQTTGIVVYCSETFEKSNNAHMRHFAPSVGINEDPVSGAASASLGCYLVHNRIVAMEEMVRVVVEQGHSMKRPGVVYIHIHTYKSKIMKAAFGGQGVITFEGRVSLPED